MKFSTFFGLLYLIIITLKLLGEITVSWVWILLPVWILPALFCLVFLIALYKDIKDKRRFRK